MLDCASEDLDDYQWQPAKDQGVFIVGKKPD